MLGLLLAPAAWGQSGPPEEGQVFQVGVGGVPGLGGQFGYISLRNFYTVEGVLYASGTPPFLGGEGTITLSTGLGGAVRILGAARVIGNVGYTGYDIDFGLRGGPGLSFRIDETRASKNRRFTLFVEPFFRFTSTFRRGRVFFLEAGFHPPLLRAGLWLTL